MDFAELPLREQFYIARTGINRSGARCNFAGKYLSVGFQNGIIQRVAAVEPGRAVVMCIHGNPGGQFGLI